MYIHSIHSQSIATANKVCPRNPKVNAKSFNTITFEGLIFNSRYQKAYNERLAVMRKYYGMEVEAIDNIPIKEAYKKNPQLTKELMVSTLKDGPVIWLEYSPRAIKMIVENNIEHPEKTELLKKCLSRSFEFHKGKDNAYMYLARDIVNRSPEDMVQQALVNAGYQENKIYNDHDPLSFYSPYLFTKAFEELNKNTEE